VVFADNYIKYIDFLFSNLNYGKGGRSMEIVIGAAPYVGLPEKKRRLASESSVEAHFLAIRRPRKHYGMPRQGEQNRRFRISGLDPAGGRILTLLVPDSNNLPKDITNGEYKIFLRFVHER
jgi:hypothetical protein